MISELNNKKWQIIPQGEWQVCPMCNGQFILNDVCLVCKGKKIINNYTGKPPKD